MTILDKIDKIDKIDIYNAFLPWYNTFNHRCILHCFPHQEFFMKKVSATTLVLGTFALLVTSAPAQHRLLHHARPGTNGSAGCCYVEQKIICYKAVTKTKTVPITTKKEVSKVVEEPFKFVEMVQVTT